jgi:sigma-B regulation protein RsbU (phosphoserine phosphatase)
MRPEYYLIFIVAAMALVFWRIVQRMRRKMEELDQARARILQEETRVFDFLHGLGEALSAETRADDLHRLIVDGAMRIAEAHGGALYLPQLKGEGLRRSYGTAQDSVIFDVPEEATKSPDLLRTFLRWHSVQAGAGLIGEVWVSGEPLMVRSDHPQLQKSGAPATAMIAPLMFSGQRLGLLFVTRRAGSEPFPGTTFQIFKTIAEQSAYALFTAAIFSEAAEKRRMDDDLVVAHEIQRILLPARSPEIAGYQISGINIPARQVSGDYYDYVPIDAGHCGVVIADVSGKGVPASLIMAMCRSVLRSQAGGQLSPAGVLRAVNAQLFPDIKEDMFISMAYAILDAQSSTITLCRAGHDAPLLYRAKDRTISRINPPGMALGIDDGGVFNRVTNDFALTLETDDCLILYTDGVTEALDPRGEEFGMEKMVESIQASAGEGTAGIIARLTDDLRAFIGPHPQNDDITLIAIRKQ